MLENIINLSNEIGRQWTLEAVEKGVPEWLAKQEPNGKIEADGSFTALTYDGLNNPFCNATLEEWKELYSVKWTTRNTIPLAEEMGMPIDTHYTDVKRERRRRFIAANPPK
jgi:hypothetical protein